MGYALTFISAILYYISFPPYTQGYLAFFSLTPLFFALSTAESVKKTIITGSIWGTTLAVLFSIPLYNALITEYEFSIIFSTVLIIFSVYIPYGIIYGIYGISFKYLFQKTGIFTPLLAASLWLIIDYLMSIMPLFMPWGYAGYTQVFTTLIQISDLSGIYGVTFLVVLVNSLFTGIFIFKKRYYKQSLLIIAFIIISTASYGFLRVQSINKIMQTAAENNITAAIIQGNFGSKEKWDSKNTAAIINTYISMTKSVIEEADIIVWPETVLNSSDKNNLEVIAGMSSLLKTNKMFIAGATRNDSKNRIFNSIFVSDDYGLKYIYDKKILFPFTESSFAGLSSGKFMDSPSIFFKGKGRPVYNYGPANIGFSICFEAIFPDYIRRIKNQGAVILINVANDSWFGNTYEPYMHFHNNIARAIENRFYVIRSSDNGISAIISPTGKIVNSIELNKRDKIAAPISIIAIPTLYSKFGDWIIIVSLLIIIISLIFQLKNKN
ncbi:MAG TPA: apolipoprotein N-acyltransferase [Spirochaetota bacterium]|nr:apolipoprotein N-acyltransferase [Spirochaetota bacterium]HPS86370.1 apolipoprotein N-acyltransferase [Spirochaetota bacterium]